MSPIAERVAGQREVLRELSAAIHGHSVSLKYRGVRGEVSHGQTCHEVKVDL